MNIFFEVLSIPLLFIVPIIISYFLRRSIILTFVPGIIMIVVYIYLKSTYHPKIYLDLGNDLLFILLLGASVVSLAGSVIISINYLLLPKFKARR